MSIPVESTGPLTWARTPFWRVVGSFASWLLFALCMTLLLQGFLGVLALGGSCASGGPYAIEVECPDAVVLFMPLSIFGGLASVAIALFFARGYGTSLIDLGWPILFGSLGAGFVASADPVGFVIGGVFLLMALIPLIISLRSSVQRVFLGAVTAHGERFYEGERPRPSLIGFKYGPSENPVRADLGHWTQSLLIWLGALALGYYLAQVAYASV